MAEHASTNCLTSRGIGAKLLRCFNMAGADPDAEIHDPETHLVSIVLEVMLGLREEVASFRNDYCTPDRTCIRDYVHVVDLTVAHVRAVETTSPGAFRQYILGSGFASVREIMDALKRVKGWGTRWREADRQPADPLPMIADVGRTARDLGFVPT